MKLDLKKILVVDVESTCWENKTDKDVSEIIQIGMCVLDFTNTLLLSFTTNEIFVKPIKSVVNEYCTNLTGLTQEIMDEKGILYSDAIQQMIDVYDSKKMTWASFGDYDKYMFETMCKLHNARYPFCARHINVKNLCALKFRWERERGMRAVLNYLNLPLEGTHHNGKDDAKNIAKILEKVLW